MDGIDLRISIFGAEPINRTLLGVADRLTDMSPAFALIIDELEEAEREQFASAGARGSGTWAELAAATIREKQRLGLDNGILIRSGFLADSLTESSAPGAVREVGATRFVYGSDAEYGVFHQQGTPHMPARTPIDLIEADKQGAVHILQRFLMTDETG